MNTNDVEKVLKSLDPSKATGPDGIGNRILKTLSNSLAPSLTTLYNKSLTNGKYPSPWKIANITPLHKKNEQSETKNYRPISLLCNVGKVMEKCINNVLLKYLLENHYIPPKWSKLLYL